MITGMEIPKRIPCRMAISKDGAPMEGVIMITGFAGFVKLDFFATLEGGPSHVLTAQIGQIHASDFVDEILGWL